jgi:protein-L-isoaspartate(D-aspartate) O-methyltransferase
MSDAEFDALRQGMVAGIAVHTVLQTGRLGKAALSRRVMDAMARVPRHAFVRQDLQHLAYADSPLPSDCGKTISQPFIVALMTDLLDLQPGDRVLEVGTGWGYQTAVLAEMGAKVYSIELIAALAEEARRRLARQGHAQVTVRVGDGRAGWPERAPFDKIIVSAAPDWVPVPLLEQLRSGGRMVIPAGVAETQQLLLIEKDAAGRLGSRAVMPVRFSMLEEPEPG